MVHLLVYNPDAINRSDIEFIDFYKTSLAPDKTKANDCSYTEFFGGSSVCKGKIKLSGQTHGFFTMRDIGIV